MTGTSMNKTLLRGVRAVKVTVPLYDAQIPEAPATAGVVKVIWALNSRTAMLKFCDGVGGCWFCVVVDS
jgi:hypothetical protein